jgi:hypothetical protein
MGVKRGFARANHRGGGRDARRSGVAALRRSSPDSRLDNHFHRSILLP